MLPEYQDITSRLGTPLWWDDNGVPRYDPFRPELCGVYDDFVAYLLIECQACRARFHVSRGSKRFIIGSNIREINEECFPKRRLYLWEYGDPPRHTINAAMCSGVTMTSDIVQIVQFWRRDRDGWERDPEQENINIITGEGT